MPRILVESARRKSAVRHGGGRRRVELDSAQPPPSRPEGLVDLDDALTRFAAIEPAKAKLVELRFFAGLSVAEAAATLGVSPATAARWWEFARLWLFADLRGGENLRRGESPCLVFSHERVTGVPRSAVMTEMSPGEAVLFCRRCFVARRPCRLSRPGLAGRDDLRRRVEQMLAGRDQVGDFLEPPGREPAAATADFPGGEETIGAVLAGKYKLVEEIGEGGMGSVFMAQQTEPVKRAVAVKVIKAGMDSKAVLARFEAERQALAIMDHPNIARVLDAGTTDGGRPFFVMELVKGMPDHPVSATSES